MLEFKLYSRLTGNFIFWKLNKFKAKQEPFFHQTETYSFVDWTSILSGLGITVSPEQNTYGDSLIRSKNGPSLVEVLAWKIFLEKLVYIILKNHTYGAFFYIYIKKLEMGSGNNFRFDFYL